MKNLIFSAVFAVVCFAATASGTKQKTVATYKATQNLVEEFGAVENVKWSPAMNNMLRADFTMDEQPVSAFFDVNGTYLACTRNLDFQNLPAKLKAAITQNINPAHITTLFEYNSADEHYFFLEETLENGAKQVWKGQSLGQLEKVKLPA